MARRSSMTGVITAVAREAARQQRASEAARRREIRAQKIADREAAIEYAEERLAEVQGQNVELADRIAELSGILKHTLSVDDSISFDSLRIADEFPKAGPPQDIKTPIPEPTEAAFLDRVSMPRGLSAIIPGAKKRYENALAGARTDFSQAHADWVKREAARKASLQLHEDQAEKSRTEFQRKKDQRNAEVSEFASLYAAGAPDAVVAYSSMVLERSDYPDDFPQEFRLAYVPESKQLVVEYELPELGVVPQVAEYRYVKAGDKVTEKPRKASEIKDLYQDIVSAVALRSIHEVLEADHGGHIDVVCFNGFVQTVDPATGKDIRPHLISVRTTRQQFLDIDLSRVEKKVCLRNLGAQVSPRAAEAQAIKPVVDFDMVDKRFVDQSDVLGDLESRPNLIELNPFEFEHLVANLFNQMGLESKLTRSSRDGGVDCVAFDPRPILGGKVVIQAKRYRNTVGVSAVRDLYGTMMNEGANKGILVTTAGYGPDAYEFSKDKPIELVDGAGLLYLLREVGVEARIVFPND